MGEMSDDAFDQAMEEDIAFYTPESEKNCKRALKLFKKDIWLTINGEEIPLTKLTDEHLRNIYTYIVGGGEIYDLNKQWRPKIEKEIRRRWEYLT